MQSSFFFRLQSALFLLLVMSVFCLGHASAQTATGAIYGTVADPSGAVVPGATVIVTDVHTSVGQTVKSDGAGNYTFPVLSPSDYKVSAQAAGFKSQAQNGVRLDANQSVHVNFAMVIGTTDQVVEVQATTTLVDTRESQIGETIDQKRIEDLPLNGRNPYDLLTILPGVTNYTADVQTGSRQGNQVIVNGVPAENTAYYLDGSYDTNVWRFGGNLLPNPDALQEFRVLTSNYDAEFGRSAGGVVQAITRSGTNKYHGLVYDYLRNNIFNAKNYFNSTVPSLHQNQFGGNLGAHVPGLRDHGFFFLSYQGLRIHQPANVNSASLVVPTTAERMGDFRNSPATVKSKITAISCNSVQYVICPALLDPVAQSLLAFVPVGSSNTSNYGNPNQQSANANIIADQGLARFDYHLGAKHQLSGTYFESRGTSNAPTVGGNQIVSYAGMSNYEGQYNAIASDVWAVSSNKVNDARAYYSLNHYIIANIYGQQHLLPSLGSLAAEGGNYNAQPYFSVQGYWQMGTSNAGPNNLPSSTLGINDTFNWDLGRHQLKLGGSYMFDKFTSTGGGSSNGLFAFTGSTTGNALADFLEGKANSLTQNNGVLFRSHSQDPSVFAQDDWHLTQRLTLNLGLRWEYFPMYTGQNNTATFVAGQQSTRFPGAPAGLVFSGDQGIPDGILKTPWNTFAPRFGFAYDVFGTGRTSLRGAYGIFYSAIDQVSVSNNLVQQPFSRSVTVSKTPNLVCPYGNTSNPNMCPAGTTAGSDPFPYTPSTTSAVFLSGANLFGLPPGDSKIPSVQQFSLGVQQQYGARWSTELKYVGNVAHHFYITTDVNSPVYRTTCTTATCLGTANINARRPYEPSPATYTFAAISVAAPSTNSAYHSLQATLTRRFDQHFSIQASYVWSKVISDGAVVNQYDVKSSRGVAAIDVPQTFVVSYIYALPPIHRFGFFGKDLLGGWQLNGVTTVRSGQPFNVTSGTDTNFDNTTNDRPNVVGIPYLPGGRSRLAQEAQFFNTAAFAVPGPGVPYGNAQFDLLFGPSYVNTDLSAFKNFALYRESTLQFRAEAFNVFNEVNFGNPISVESATNFGALTSATSPRILQFALRLSF
jgi:hypothetical protein